MLHEIKDLFSKVWFQSNGRYNLIRLLMPGPVVNATLLKLKNQTIKCSLVCLKSLVEQGVARISKIPLKQPLSWP